MESDGLLVVAKKGGQEGTRYKATRYYYIGDENDN
jgi:hypothetical protein